MIEEVVIRFNHERGITTVLVEHNVAFARGASQSLVMMVKRSIAFAGPIAELMEEFIH